MRLLLNVSGMQKQVNFLRRLQKLPIGNDPGVAEISPGKFQIVFFIREELSQSSFVLLIVVRRYFIFIKKLAERLINKDLSKTGGVFFKLFHGNLLSEKITDGTFWTYSNTFHC